MPKAPPVAGVVLAAGRSERMGRNKLLLDAGGEPIVRRIVSVATGGGLDPVIVVLGFEAVGVAHALEGLSYLPISNPEFAAGINGSVRLGLATVPDACDAAVVLLGDMPLVTTEMVAALVDRFRETAAPLVMSSYDGVQAPPTLYARPLFGAFTEVRGEGAGKRVVDRHRAEAAVVEWPRDRLADIDRPSEYEALAPLLIGAGELTRPLFGPKGDDGRHAGGPEGRDQGRGGRA